MINAPLTSTVSGLSDRRLLAQIKEMVEREKHFTLVIVDHLREIEARSLHLERGFGSLFDYAVTELGYTSSAAWRRIQAMHLSSQIDGVRERLDDGSLTVTAATQLQTAIERNERQAAVAAGAGAKAAPSPVLDVSARKALVEQASGKSTREVERMVASVDPTLVAPREKVRQLTDGKWELKAVIDDECERGLKELKRLLSHTNPSMTYGELVGRLAQAAAPGRRAEGLDRHDPGRRFGVENSQANWQMTGGASPLDGRSSHSTTPREPCVGVGDGTDEASVAVRVGRVSSVEREMIWSAETLRRVEGNTGCDVRVRSSRAPRRLRPLARMYVICRDLGDLRVALVGRHQGRKGKADSRSRRCTTRRSLTRA